MTEQLYDRIIESDEEQKKRVKEEERRKRLAPLMRLISSGSDHR